MDINEIHKLILFYADKDGNGSITHEDIDLALDRASIAQFNEYYNNPKAYVNGRPVPPIGYGETQRINDALSPFKSTYTFTNVNTTGGLLTLPNDYMYLISLYITIFNASLNKNDVYPVQVLNEEELIYRLSSQVVPVTGSNPICIMNSQKKIQLFPETPQSGKVFYFRRPAKPVFAYTQTDRTITYNAGSSVQLEWGEQDITNVINKAMSILGLHLSDQEISQYAAYKDQKGE